ncbi:MAG: hypothetical protein DMG57_42240 [Acidobacteria bacterium]|nr:MAG: hypothetical protein DMG57_42240 [Acidobacteriota bacterium]
MRCARCGTIPASRWSAMSTIKSLRVRNEAADPIAMLSAAAIPTAALILMAGLAPAARVSQTDPLTALRHE